MQIGFDAKRIFHNSSGLGNYSRDVVRILADQFPSNTYWLYNPRPGKINPFAGRHNIVEQQPVSFFDKIFSSYWRRSRIGNLLKKQQPDIFHGLSNELPTTIAASGVASVVTVHDLIFMRYPQWYKKADVLIHRLKVQQACKQADKIIAISQQTKNDLVDLLQVEEKKIHVIYQGCHTAFKQTYSREEIKTVSEKFALPPQFILNVGTIEERKNLLTVVKSLLHHSLPLVVVGRDTAYKKTLDAFIAEHNLGSRVMFLKNVNMPELSIIYQQAAVFCYPSIFEGFGIPIIEALYSKTPVITSKGGCFPEAGGPDSFYIDSFDEIELANIVIRLQQDEALRQSTITNGLEYAQRFNDDKVGRNIFELYQEVIAKSKNNH